MAKTGGKFMEGFILAAGATLGVIATVGILNAIGAGWAPNNGTGTTAAGRAYRVSPINPNLDYSTIKGFRGTAYRTGVSRLRTL